MKKKKRMMKDRQTEREEKNWRTSRKSEDSESESERDRIFIVM